jgi:hypothetical protein
LVTAFYNENNSRRVPASFMQQSSSILEVRRSHEQNRNRESKRVLVRGAAADKTLRHVSQILALRLEYCYTRPFPRRQPRGQPKLDFSGGFREELKIKSLSYSTTASSDSAPSRRLEEVSCNIVCKTWCGLSEQTNSFQEA